MAASCQYSRGFLFLKKTKYGKSEEVKGNMIMKVLCQHQLCSTVVTQLIISIMT